ncbi:uncharacterized protein IUM83_04303 [Phytophthora cinnamomi]|uniref:uncharacterized protein n=1 Tax=Phytophthora cinnamomi TaxID=4785 RepID=UPI003559844D|nr:hypothetical protein IUM83_04303 [Phytophthora cinnamomi]
MLWRPRRTWAWRVVLLAVVLAVRFLALYAVSLFLALFAVALFAVALFAVALFVVLVGVALLRVAHVGVALVGMLLLGVLLLGVLLLGVLLLGVALVGVALVGVLLVGIGAVLSVVIARSIDLSKRCIRLFGPTIRALSMPDRQIYAVVKRVQREAEDYAYEQVELTDGSENATVVTVHHSDTGRWKGEPPREVCRPREEAAMRQVTEEEETSRIRTYIGICVAVPNQDRGTFHQVAAAIIKGNVTPVSAATTADSATAFTQSGP